MPVYVYRCQDCATVLERRQSFSDAPLTVCETCGGELRKVLQPVGIIFKGSGFYSTDHRNGANSSTGEDHGHTHGSDTHTDDKGSDSGSSKESSDAGSSSSSSSTSSDSSSSASKSSSTTASPSPSSTATKSD